MFSLYLGLGHWSISNETVSCSHWGKYGSFSVGRGPHADRVFKDVRLLIGPNGNGCGSQVTSCKIPRDLVLSMGKWKFGLRLKWRGHDEFDRIRYGIGNEGERKGGNEDGGGRGQANCKWLGAKMSHII